MKKNTQTGRSMIEMLGTLAIIGVLSVGGIAGFNTAITKHRTNDITDFLNRTTVLTQALLLNNNLTLASVQDTIDQLNSSYLATAVMCSSGYAVNMAGLPKGVCENFTDMADDNHYIDELKLFIGTDCTPGSVSCTSDDENAISFIFDTNVLSDALDEGGFYWCENGTIQNKSGKVATCNCSESDEEFYYDSDEEAIAAMCTEREYYCSVHTIKRGDYIGPTIYHNSECFCVTKTAYYDSDEEAINEMCTNRPYYFCSGNTDGIGLGTDGGWVREWCNCSGATSFYDSDEEAIAAMCSSMEYKCTSDNLLVLNGSVWTGVTVCDCIVAGSTGVFYADAEAIAAMCEEEEDATTPNPEDPSYYYCNPSELRKALNNGQSAYVSSCACVSGSTAYYDSDEEAIAAMCQNTPKHYTCSAGGFIYGLDTNNQDFHYNCFCSNNNYDSYYASDEDAIAQMCSSTYYFCSENGIYRDAWGQDYYIFYGTYNCATTSAIFNSDQEAIEAMSQFETVTQTQTVTPTSRDMYTCSGFDGGHGSDFIVKNNSTNLINCQCDTNKEGYYGSDEEAIAAMCEEAGGPLYQCYNNNLQVYDSTGGWYHVTTCNCSGSTTYYDSNEEAIEAMCQNQHYGCSTNAFIYKNNGEHVTSCLCTNGGYYSSDDEAIAAMCTGGIHYICSTGNFIYRPGNSYVSSCSCTTGGYFSSDSQAIDALCQKGGDYFCADTNNQLARALSNDSLWIVKEECFCKKASGRYSSDDEAIAAMCYTPNYGCTGEQLHRLDAPYGTVYADCGCNYGSFYYYESDEEAIAAVCKK